ncbi:redoxin family protein [Demequina zhanjiangensis]|uniref:Redoxin family protein n=1 Tax=Demequina zhanjiangensis TaxID=3051659 RepID=A0ABT8G549_9MICO|nr:redoxin family protein [Demequina sp. SYSU T00b26]MDN4473839.1 redoxin family protein [Demequina sp. SYSU T00b26]
MNTLRTVPAPVVRAALLGGAAFALAACASPGAEPASTPDAEMSATHDAMESGDAMTDDAMDEESMSDDTMDEAAADVPEQLQFTTTLLADGATFDGASLAGQDTLIWVWASWCPTCQAEAPEVVDAASRLPEGVGFYGLPGKSDVADAQAFVDEYGVDGFPHLFDDDGTLWANFGVSYQPALVLIDDDGSVEVMPGATDADGIVAAAEKLAAS